MTKFILEMEGAVENRHTRASGPRIILLKL